MGGAGEEARLGWEEGEVRVGRRGRLGWEGVGGGGEEWEVRLGRRGRVRWGRGENNVHLITICSSSRILLR